MATIKQQVARAAEEVGDDTANLICFYEPRAAKYRWRDSTADPLIRCSFDELPEREFDEGYGGREGERFIGFSEHFVYVCGTYDGSEWITAVPRDPAVVERTKQLPIIGGG